MSNSVVFFEATVKYSKIDETSGKDKKVSEKYLFDALSYTEAETLVNEQMEQIISGEFDVKTITKKNYSECVINEAYGIDYIWNFKIEFIMIDEEAGKEKKSKFVIILNGDDLESATKHVHEHLKGMTVDYDIVGATRTNIIEFFPYDHTTTEDHESPENTEGGQPSTVTDSNSVGEGKRYDDLIFKAARHVTGNNDSTTSSLQRVFLLGYNRATKIIEELEVLGVVGEFTGATTRDILVSFENIEEHLNNKGLVE